MGYICYICRMIRKTLFALMFFAQVFFVQAQDSLKIGTAHLAYDVRDYSFFDNREVRTPYQRSQTLFGTCLMGEVGVEWDAHAVMVGGYGIKDFGYHGIIGKLLDIFLELLALSRVKPYVVSCQTFLCMILYVTIHQCFMVRLFSILGATAMLSFIVIGLTNRE